MVSKSGHTLLTASQSIFENLFEAQEFQDRKVDTRMESEPSLIRTESRIKLHSISAVDLHLSLVVFPRDTKLDDTFWDSGNLKGFLILWVLLEERGVLEC